jgi:putative transcriptional regulator
MEAYSTRQGERMTYEELSRKTGLSRATLEAIGSRPNYNTTLATLDKLCTALRCEPSDIITYQHPDGEN